MGMGHGAWGMGHWAFLVPSRSQVSRFSFPGYHSQVEPGNAVLSALQTPHSLVNKGGGRLLICVPSIEPGNEL
jgi:hypothetical protein